MQEIFQQSYYYLDLLIGYGSPFAVYLLYRLGKADRFIWHAYWIGFAIGLLWEVPIFVLSGEATPWPIIVWARPLLTHYSVFLLCHSLWDGLLFTLGIWLVRRLCRPPHFLAFSWKELWVLLIWGQLSELAVELSSTFNDGWYFLEYWWNPVLFKFNGHNIAILMQLVWFVAILLFYYIMLHIRPRYSTENTPNPASEIRRG